MGNKTKKKKPTKIDPLQHEKDRLFSIISRLDECVQHNKGNSLESYFKRLADLNRERLKEIS